MSSKDKVTKQKDPKRQAAGLKAHEKHMLKLKEEILKNSGSDSGNSSIDGTSSSTTASGNSSSDGGSSTTTGGTYVNFNHMYGVGAMAVLALAVCIFVIPKLTTNPKNTKAEPKDVEKTQNIRRKML